MAMNSFGKRNFMQPNGKAQACTQGALLFFLLSLGGGGWRIIIFFFPASHCVLNMFLLSSQWVPNTFPKFPMCSPTFSLYHLTFIPYALANVVLLLSNVRNSILQNRTFYLEEPP
jgi:hypothetical protein